MNLNLQNMTSDRIQDALYGFTRSQILFTALDLDIFTHIHRGANTLEALLAQLDLNARGLRILLDGLVGIRFLTKDEDGVTYHLPEDIANFLVRDSESYMGGMVHHCKQLYENWAMLTDAVRSGQPVGGSLSLNQLEAYFAELVKGLYVSNYPAAKKLASLLGIGAAHQGLEILDVAGGSGVWSIAMLEKDPASRATILDFPAVTHIAEEYIQHHGLADRYEFWPADLEDMEWPENRFDLAIMANICHAIGPVSTRKLLKGIARTLKPGGRVAIVDFVPDARRSRAGWPLIFGVNMLILTPEGDVFTADQYGQWLSEAGFGNVLARELEADVTTIIADK